MKKFFNEYKKFISRGNVIDLAVGVVIGGAFTKIVNSLVSGIIMPLISLVVGGNDVTDWKWVIKEAVYNLETNQIETAEIAFNYGLFIQSVIDFLIIGFIVFLFVKAINTVKEAAEESTKKLEEVRIEALKKMGQYVETQPTEEPALEPAPEPTPAPAPAPIPASEKILIEIRDLLKEQQKGNQKTGDK